MMLRLQEAASSASPVPSTDDYSSDTSVTSVDADDRDGRRRHGFTSPAAAAALVRPAASTT